MSVNVSSLISSNLGQLHWKHHSFQIKQDKYPLKGICVNVTEVSCPIMKVFIGFLNIVIAIMSIIIMVIQVKLIICSITDFTKETSMSHGPGSQSGTTD